MHKLVSCIFFSIYLYLAQPGLYLLMPHLYLSLPLSLLLLFSRNVSPVEIHSVISSSILPSSEIIELRYFNFCTWLTLSSPSFTVSFYFTNYHSFCFFYTFIFDYYDHVVGVTLSGFFSIS